jgi:hypothetical protein
MVRILREISAREGCVPNWDYGVPEREGILRLLPDLPAAHMDLGKALYLSGDLTRAEGSISRAMEMGFPLPGLGYNYLAAIRVSQKQYKGAIGFLAAAKKSGQFSIVDENLKILREWLSTGGLQSGSPPDLVVYHEFERFRTGTQPVVPAPITLHGQGFPEETEVLRLTPVQ